MHSAGGGRVHLLTRHLAVVRLLVVARLAMSSALLSCSQVTDAAQGVMLGPLAASSSSDVTLDSGATLTHPTGPNPAGVSSDTEMSRPATSADGHSELVYASSCAQADGTGGAGSHRAQALPRLMYAGPYSVLRVEASLDIQLQPPAQESPLRSMESHHASSASSKAKWAQQQQAITAQLHLDVPDRSLDLGPGSVPM
jgi:hypothetical protein